MANNGIWDYAKAYLSSPISTTGAAVDALGRMGAGIAPWLQKPLEKISGGVPDRKHEEDKYVTVRGQKIPVGKKGEDMSLRYRDIPAKAGEFLFKDAAEVMKKINEGAKFDDLSMSERIALASVPAELIPGVGLIPDIYKLAKASVTAVGKSALKTVDDLIAPVGVTDTGIPMKIDDATNMTKMEMKGTVTTKASKIRNEDALNDFIKGNISNKDYFKKVGTEDHRFLVDELSKISEQTKIPIEDLSKKTGTKINVEAAHIKLKESWEKGGLRRTPEWEKKHMEIMKETTRKDIERFKHTPLEEIKNPAVKYGVEAERLGFNGVRVGNIYNDLVSEIARLSPLNTRVKVRNMTKTIGSRMLKQAVKHGVEEKEFLEILSQVDTKKLSELMAKKVKLEADIAKDIEFGKIIGLKINKKEYQLDLGHIEAISENWKTAFDINNLFFEKLNINRSLHKSIDERLSYLIKRKKKSRSVSEKQRIVEEMKDIEQILIDNNIITKVEGITLGKHNKELIEKEIKELVSGKIKTDMKKSLNLPLDPMEQKYNFNQGGIASISQLTRTLRNFSS